MAKRGSNEGSIFEERPGRWVAIMQLGYEIVGGKRRRKRRKFVGPTRQAVSERLTEALGKHQRGGLIASGRDKLGQFLEAWLENTVKPSVRPKTYRSYEQMVRNHLVKGLPTADWSNKHLDNIPGLGTIRLRDLDVVHIERFMKAKITAGNSPSLVRYLRTVLRIALNEAVRRGILDRNVAALVRPVSGGSSTRAEPLTAEQAQHLYYAVQGHRLEALFTVALAIGLRHGEALALQWSEVDLKQGELRVFHTLQRVDGVLSRTPTKSEESRRVVPLDQLCLRTLEEHGLRQQREKQFAGDHWKETGYVFTSSIGTPLIDRNVLREFYKLLRVAGLPRLRFHDLRHACVSLLAAQGVPEKTIAEIVGHSDVRLTKNVYQHAQKEAKRDGISKVASFLSGPVAPHVAPLQPPRKLN